MLVLHATIRLFIILNGMHLWDTVLEPCYTCEKQTTNLGCRVQWILLLYKRGCISRTNTIHSFCSPPWKPLSSNKTLLRAKPCLCRFWQRAGSGISRRISAVCFGAQQGMQGPVTMALVAIGNDKLQWVHTPIVLDLCSKSLALSQCSIVLQL